MNLHYKDSIAGQCFFIESWAKFMFRIGYSRHYKASPAGWFLLYRVLVEQQDHPVLSFMEQRDDTSVWYQTDAGELDCQPSKTAIMGQASNLSG